MVPLRPPPPPRPLGGHLSPPPHAWLSRVRKKKASSQAVGEGLWSNQQFWLDICLCPSLRPEVEAKSYVFSSVSFEMKYNQVGELG